MGGRALTLYEEVHPQAKLNNRLVHIRFLKRLAELLPPGVAPIIVADAAFRVPFHRAVERRGWRWVGRVRGRDFVRLSRRWASCTTVFRRATATPRLPGTGDWVRSNALRALFVLVNHPPQGRRGKTAAGKRSRSKKAVAAARNAKEPWLPVASPRLAERTAKQIVRLHRQRMQIEEAFRDMKSRHFGAGLERSRSRSAGRCAVLVPIASLAAFALWLIGTAAIERGLDRHLRPGSRKRRVYSRPFLARLLLTLEDYRPLIGDLSAAIENIARWAAEHHRALLAESVAAG
ncbi:MAG: IS4 family transposase [Thiohalocapsa sp. PB-PSB1]|nr:MAG: IS4 family transposase [Thiohalocapsa sp. PB-PSB1]